MSCRFPLGAITVLTGVSGSGKSTLAFDTLYAEGQRRYVTSLSTYARQFLERLPRPDVDFISNLPPAIAIERRNRVTGARATVGTATEILDLLRLLYAKIGETICPRCEVRVASGTVEAVTEHIGERWRGRRVQIGAPLVRQKGERAGAERDRLLADGYGRLLASDGSATAIDGLSVKEFSALRRDSLLLVDRLAVHAGESETRTAEAVAVAYGRGDDRCVVVGDDGERETFHRGFVCDGCGETFAVPEPSLFSFNSPLGACAECQGFGRVPVLDRNRVVADSRKSLASGAVVPFTTPSGQKWQQRLLAACAEAAVDPDTPFEKLPEPIQEWVFQGDGAVWKGVQAYFDRLERKRYKVQNRVQIARYRRFDPCPACQGARLRAEARCVQIEGLGIAELNRLTVAKVSEWLAGLTPTPAVMARAGRLLDDLGRRLETTLEVGLDYVTLDRPMRTLSGGEAQRIQLAAALGGALTASLYVLDEPSVGLHPSDMERLVGILRKVRDRGNTLVVVEHAPELIAAADHVVDLGPGAGRLGGQVIAEGSFRQIRESETSLTGRALRGELSSPRASRPAALASLRVLGARSHNLDNLDVEIPLGQLVVVTGVSGAGKTSLVRDVIVGNLRRDPERGACDRIEGAEWLEQIVVVDPTPSAKRARSNPATVSKAFDPIRQRFAATRAAADKGLAPGYFSFNVSGGRCETCEGSGEVVVDMHFLDDVRMTCDACDGTRYRPEVREITLAGLTIVDVLELSVEGALEHFADDRKVESRLRPLADVGLGYIALGQPLSTLSSGETQRLQLAQALAAGGGRTLFVFDEPTTGLHPADIEVLIGCIDRLLDAGGSALAVEHNLDVIRRADHVIDLGPGGGPAGGRVVASGTPEEIAACDASATGRALRVSQPVP